MNRLLALPFILATAAPSWAGDIAQLDILGFSADGKIFAFEEHGVQDGSGFPYANRFYIDTATDSFVAGSPVRVRLDDEAATVASARDKARAQGSTIVSDEILRANAGYLAGFNAITELSAEADAIRVNPRPVEPAIDPALSFKIEQFALAAPAGSCDGIDGIAGFRLSRADGDQGQPVLVHEDKSIPKSRNCPQGYRVGGVQTFYPEGGQPVFAVIVAVRSFGFEGPDYRWIALTGKL